MTELSTTITACRICGSGRIPHVLDLGEQPLANSLRRDFSEKLPVFPLIICRCDDCGTIQLTETIAPEILFREYLWVTGTSEGARRYSITFCERLASRCREGKLFVVEVASNDGTFLKRFLERGDKVLGVDPAKNIAEMAERDGVPTVSEFFGETLATGIVAREGEADAVFARNVIPHVANANDVVAGIAKCLKPDGTGAIEFHRADVILEELHYDSIYHEHLYFHSLHSMGRMLARHALIPFDVTTSPISGGSYVIYFSKTKRDETEAFKAAVDSEELLGVGRAEPWAEFARRCVRHAKALRSLVETKKREGKRISGYGASARSSTMLNFAGINNQLVDVVMDRAPLKHDMLTPGTNIPVLPPTRAFAANPDVILLLAWNFRDEIFSQMREEFGWKGEVIVPLPGDPHVVAFK